MVPKTFYPLWQLGNLSTSLTLSLSISLNGFQCVENTRLDPKSRDLRRRRGNDERRRQERGKPEKWVSSTSLSSVETKTTFGKSQRSYRKDLVQTEK